MDADLPDATLWRLVHRFEESVSEVSPLRDEIIASWRRSVLAGLRSERFEVPYESDVDAAGRLGRAAAPVIEHAADDLCDTRVALLLTDRHGQVLARREGSKVVASLLDRIQLAPGFVYREDAVGTNAIGTAIERRAPSVVHGQEHFADALTGMACAATTVIDPVTGRVIGVVDLTCAAEDVSPLMLPLTKQVARDIEQRLLDDASLDERVLRGEFLKVRRTARDPIISLNDRIMLVSGAAAATVQDSDRSPIWEWALHALTDGRQDWAPLGLNNGQSVAARCEPVLDGPRIVGAVVHLNATTGHQRRLWAQRRAGNTPAVGWPSLTLTERAVAEHVAHGMTNAEAAARLCLSRHTIDYHLRQVFRKLDVRSRVELTRIILKQTISSRVEAASG